MNDELNEIPGATPDFRTELAEKLAELVPEAVADGKIDTKKLEELLEGDAADAHERFGLFWPGKKRALRAAQEPTTATLVPDKENSKDWDTTQNVFIEGDNLEVLKILQKHYHGKIKMIYIDPPYNTGQDFVYPDNYQEGLKSYLEFTKQIDEGGKKLSTNSDQAGRYHSNWLNMMYPRLKLARNLMTNDGIIMISIDDNEVANLRRLTDEVFGESNFIDCIIWKKRYGGGPKEKYLVTVHEYVLVYSRNISAIDSLGVPTSDEQVAQYYTLKDDHFEERGPYRRHPLEAVKSLDTRPNLVYDIEAPDGSLISPKRQWIWSQDRVARAVSEGRLDFVRDRSGEWSVHTKQYLYDESGQVRKTKAMSLVDNIYTQHGTNESVELLGDAKIFPFPKPSSYLERLIQMADRDEDSIILDFFAGSGTTGQAVMNLNAADGGNRKYILVQLPEPVPAGSAANEAGFETISQISRKRLKVAADKLRTSETSTATRSGHGLDVGFRSYRLAETNFTEWRLTSDVPERELEQHLLSLRESADDQASQEALLTELLLKRGYSLTEQVDVFDVSGLEMHGVKDAEGDYGLLAYPNEHQKPTLEQLRALVDAAEAQIVILEDAFQGDDQLKTNLAQLCKSKGIELWTA